MTLSFLAGGANAAPVTIDFWTAWDPTKAAEAAIAEFEKANPDIAVKTQVIAFDAFHEKLVTAVSSGDAPDLSWGLAEWFGELNRMGALADLSGRMAAWPDRDKIYPDALHEPSVDGKLVALPNHLGLRGLLHHSDMLKAADLTEPPKTWDERFTALAPVGVAFPPVALGSITRAMEESIGRVLLKNEDPEKVAARLGEAVNKGLRQSGQLASQ